jgi:hypothetical protein
MSLSLGSRLWVQQEAKTDTLEVNFDLATCQQMIDFLYTGDYQHSTPEPTSDANQLIDELRQHVEVNKIADYYGVDPLCELASSKMSCIFLEDWSADIFTTILEMGFHAIGNIAFHKMAAGVTSAHIQELSAHAAFSKLDFPAKFTAQLVLATSNITASWQRCQSAAKHQCPKTTARAKYTINSEPYGWNIGFTCTYCGETF